jgi:hypothetical protein
VTPALLSFAAAGGEIPDSKAWTLGWTTELPGEELDRALRKATRTLK